MVAVGESGHVNDIQSSFTFATYLIISNSVRMNTSLLRNCQFSPVKFITHETFLSFKYLVFDIVKIFKRYENGRRNCKISLKSICNTKIIMVLFILLGEEENLV